jgi:hypothetical protein
MKTTGGRAPWRSYIRQKITMERPQAVLLTLVLAALVGRVKGGVEASCLYTPQSNTYPDYKTPTYWTTKYDKLTGYTWAPLSQCQATSLNLGTQTHKILLGADADASVVGISVGSSGGGCKSPNACMPACQALLPGAGLPLCSYRPGQAGRRLHSG